MARKLTITLDDAVYFGLHRKVGRGRIGKFLESLVRPHVVQEDLGAAYREMAGDEEREADAREWTESLVGDILNEARLGAGGSDDQSGAMVLPDIESFPA